MNTIEIIALSSNGTPVYSHPEAHPHRIDLAAEAIKKMVVPAAPADPTDRSQTRHCEVIDFGRIIGKNHLVKFDPFEDDDAEMIRGNRSWFSHMVLKEAADETRLTSVLFWNAENSCWVLWTNYEGEDTGYPEPGSDRYNNAPEEFKAQCKKFWETHGLVPTDEDIKKAKERLQYLEDNEDYDDCWFEFDNLTKILNYYKLDW